MVYFPTAANLAMKDYLHWFKKKKKGEGMILVNPVANSEVTAHCVSLYSPLSLK